MKVLIISQYFYPESGAGSARAVSHAKYLSKLGHKVTVICGSPNYPTGKIYRGYRNSLRHEENVNSVRVIRTLVFPTIYSSFLRRSLNYLSFSLSSILEILRKSKFDVILASSPPMLVFPPSILTKYLKKAPLVLDIRDIWPGAVVASGNLKSKFLINLLVRLERFSYKKAAKIITINEGSKTLILESNEFLNRSEVSVVYNGVDLSEFDKFTKRKSLLKFGKDETFKIIYTGTIGEQYDFDLLVEAMELLQKISIRVQFFIIGSGSKKDKVMKTIEERDLRNASLYGIKEYNKIPAILEKVHLGIVPLRKNAYLDSAYPVKVFDYMAAGKPVLVCGGLALKELIEENQAGFWVPAEDPEALAGKILEISKMPKIELEEMGKRGRKLVEREFNREKQAKKLEEILQGIVKQ